MTWQHQASRPASQRALLLAFAITVSFLVVEIVGGVLTNSLALLADAGHMLSDVAALGLGIFAIWMAMRPATATRTYGFHRVEILAALANGVMLVAIAIYIFWQAGHRLQEPPEVKSLLNPKAVSNRSILRGFFRIRRWSCLSSEARKDKGRIATFYCFCSCVFFKCGFDS